MTWNPPRQHLDRDGRARCGAATPRLTADEDAVTCGNCLDLLAGVYRLGRTIADPKPCGTNAAYRRHLRHGEPACESCRQANARRTTDYYKRAGRDRQRERRKGRREAA